MELADRQLGLRLPLRRDGIAGILRRLLGRGRRLGVVLGLADTSARPLGITAAPDGALRPASRLMTVSPTAARPTPLAPRGALARPTLTLALALLTLTLLAALTLASTLPRMTLSLTLLVLPWATRLTSTTLTLALTRPLLALILTILPRAWPLSLSAGALTATYALLVLALTRALLSRALALNRSSRALVGPGLGCLGLDAGLHYSTDFGSGPTCLPPGWAENVPPEGFVLPGGEPVPEESSALLLAVNSACSSASASVSSG